MSIGARQIRIRRTTWWRFVRKLRERGGGVRESGGFLLGRVGRDRVCECLYYDDLDPGSLDSGIIRLDGAAMIAVYDRCEERGLEVLADVHTHSGHGVWQSVADETNPTVRKVGHTAIIVPHYAGRNSSTLKGCGIYNYLGNHRWRTCEVSERRIKLKLF